MVIEITVAMNNEKEGEEGKGVCLFVHDHITHFSGGAEPTDEPTSKL